MKIGILGGTFLPVHRGHIEIARLAAEKLYLDKVVFVPNNLPPHKTKSDISIEHKLGMLRSALSDEKNMEIDYFEIDNGGISYLYITLEYLSKKYSGDELYFICGGDNVDEIRNWKNPSLIFKYAAVVFVKRPHFKITRDKIDKLKKDFNGNAIVIDFGGIDISSTDIRDKFENFEWDIYELMPETLDYICENAVYPHDKIKMLKGMMKESRFVHSLNVSKEAYRLAKVYNENPVKAYYAGLLHDCAKNIPMEEQSELINKYNEYELMENELSYPHVIHALCGAVVAKRIFGVTDKKILDGIRFHTLGNKDMSLFDKIIYIADLISEDRKYNGVESIRKRAYDDIDSAVLKSVENTINYLGEKNVQKDVLLLRDKLKEKF